MLDYKDAFLTTVSMKWGRIKVLVTISTFDFCNHSAVNVLH